MSSGLYSVAFTDIIQLVCIFVGLIFSIPFMTTSSAVTIPLQTHEVALYPDKVGGFFGKLNAEDGGVWVSQLLAVLYSSTSLVVSMLAVLYSSTSVVVSMFQISICLLNSISLILVERFINHISTQ